jgi:hypothetical protein
MRSHLADGRGSDAHGIFQTRDIRQKVQTVNRVGLSGFDGCAYQVEKALFFTPRRPGRSARTFPPSSVR